MYLRPAKPTVAVQARVTPELHAALTRAASRSGVSINALLREALIAYLPDAPPAAAPTSAMAGQLEIGEVLDA